MSSSLDSLVNNLAGGGEQFFGFKEYNENQYKLLIKKGIYPYEYINDWDKFKETKLSPKEAFYSKLNMTGVREEDYEHTNRIWKEFGLKDLGEYHNLYLKTDVILLANVIEAFRKVCLANYGLDQGHFYTAPRLAWKACLKKTRISLELLLDLDMLLVFERPSPLIDGLRLIIHIWVTSSPLINQLDIYNIWMPTIYMVGQCLNHYLPEGSNGLKLNLIKSCNLQNASQRDIFWR